MVTQQAMIDEEKWNEKSFDCRDTPGREEAIRAATESERDRKRLNLKRRRDS
jgi:hypothetical protein